MKTKASVLVRDLFRACGNWVCRAALMTVATDGLGSKAPFPALSLGTYYVFAMGRYNNRSIVWNLPVNLKAGQNSAVLENAAWMQR
jgi:hypothetical protein